MESLRWGFNDLGYPCAIRINQADRAAVNILFGWATAMQMGHLNEFPAGSILYNFEQYANNNLASNALFGRAAERFQIWDYSQANIPRWQEINPKFPPYYARVSYAPTLGSIPYAKDEDIDILYIGSLSPRRALSLMASADTLNRNSLVSLGSVWGRQRDEFISRAKILLNISHDDPDYNIFEIVRVSYYLANRKAVVCEATEGMIIEEDMRRVLKCVPLQDLGAVCDELVHDPGQRQAYAEDCFQTFQQRDVRQVIKGYFGA